MSQDWSLTVDNSRACTKCGQIKKLDEFALVRQKPGRQCQACVTNYRREWRNKNPQKTSDYQKKYHAKNPGLRSKWNAEWRKANSQKRSQYLKEYRVKNQEAIAAKSRERRLNNLDYYKAKALIYQKANPALFRKNSANRRAAMKQVSRHIVTIKDLAKILSKPCQYCGNPSEHIDHIIPISRGGSHSIGNLTGACASCNLSKSAKFITEWKKGKNEN